MVKTPHSLVTIKPNTVALITVRGVKTAELSRADKVLKQKDIANARDTCDSAWESYLSRTGQSPEFIKNVLKQVKEEAQ